MKISATSFLALPALPAAARGFGSSVKACVSMEVEPAEPFTVNWKIGATGDQCMSSKGTAGDMKVSKQGLTCHDIGWVSVDDGAFGCHWYESWWTLSYTATGASYSGSARSRWKYWNSLNTVTISQQSPGTQLCGSEALCPTTEIEWSGNSNGLYFVYQPSKVGTYSAASNDTEVVHPEL